MLALTEHGKQSICLRFQFLIFNQRQKKATTFFCVSQCLLLSKLCNQSLQSLTMTQNFKILKNTSLKNIKQIESNKKASKESNGMQQKLSKEHKRKNILKLIHLEPLKTEAYSQQLFKKTQMKFDLTQPVNIKANGQHRNDCRYENALLAPLEGRQKLKQKSLDKQNRPASMNELNYLNIARLKQTLENSLKNDSSKMLQGINPKKGQPLQQINLDEITSKDNQSKIVKSHSRARFLKLGQKDKKILTQGEENNEREVKIPVKFRKGIIDHIFCKNKQQKGYDIIEVKEELNMIPQSSLKLSIMETYNNSPIIKKPQTIFEVNCSTINERQENASSFISKKAVQQFIQPLQVPTQFSPQKTPIERKRKVQLDKIRKRFPENFFK